MNKIIYMRLLWVETHLMSGVSFIHALKCVAISPDLQVGGIKIPPEQYRALAQVNFSDQLCDHLII